MNKECVIISKQPKDSILILGGYENKTKNNQRKCGLDIFR